MINIKVVPPLVRLHLLRRESRDGIYNTRPRVSRDLLNRRFNKSDLSRAPRQDVFCKRIYFRNAYLRTYSSVH